MTPKNFNFQKTFYSKNYSYFNDQKNASNFFGCWKVKYVPILCLYFWGPKQWEGTISKKRRSFHWFSRNSELEATWISLIGWPHKTSSMYVYYANWQNLIDSENIFAPSILNSRLDFEILFKLVFISLFFGKLKTPQFTFDIFWPL